MNINDIVSTIVERINIAEDLEKIDTEIVDWLNNGAKSLKSSFLNNDLISSLTTISDNNNRTVNLSKTEIIANLTKLRTGLKNIPVLEVVVSFVPDRDFEDQLSSLIKKDFKGLFILKFSTNTDLIAGAQVGFKGKFKDYSLLKEFNDNRETLFGEVLKDYD